MVTIVTRLAKGSELTHAELDGNFNNLASAVDDLSAAVGAGLAIRYIYSSAAIVPALPADNTTIGWNIAASSTTVWQAFQTNVLNDVGAVTSYGPWGTPIKVKGESGLPGSAGQGAVKGFSFIRATSTPATPVGGAFATPSATGWSDGVPAGTNPIYVTTRLFTSDGLAPQQATWTAPVLLAQDGADGSGAVPRHIFSSAISAPTLPAANATTGWDVSPTITTNWMSIQLNIVDALGLVTTYGAWGTAIKIRGETGAIGPLGVRGPYKAVVVTPSAAWSDSLAFNGITILANSGSYVVIGDEVIQVYPNATNPTWILTKRVTVTGNPGTWVEPGIIVDGNLIVTKTLSAGALKTSSLSAGTAITVGDATNGIVISSADNTIKAVKSGVERTKFGNLGTTYGISGRNAANIEVFRLDENGLQVKPRLSELGLFGSSYNMPLIIQGFVDMSEATAGTIVQNIPIPLWSAGSFRVIAQVVGYCFNEPQTTSSANSKYMMGQFYFNNATSAGVYMATTVISSDTSDATNFPASKIDFVFDAVLQNLSLRLASKTSQGAWATTYYQYMVWAISEGNFGYDNTYG